MKQGLSLRVSQHLALTPQLQQSIRLLQLSTLELSQEIEQMLDDNPFLEVNHDEVPREEFGLAQADTPVPEADREIEFAAEYAAPMGDGDRASTPAEAESPVSAEPEAPNWDGDGSTEVVADDGEWGGDAPARKNNLGDGEDVDATDLARGHESLQSHLHRQALSLRLSEEDSAALRFLIESLNDDGYLEEPLAALAAGLAPHDPGQQEELEHRFTMALHLLHHLEPVGVGARSLAECLSLQLRVLCLEAPAEAACHTALRICAHPIDLLARRDVRRLAQLCGDSDVMPRLRVHDIYANALKQNKGQGGAALQQRLQEARWFIKNIQQRFDTILRVSNAIVERQKNFFVHGELAMRPLVLREIADELGLHESTISRVTTAKYMSTPYGTFELKYFFGSALGTETGGNASSTAVRALIRQFVASENLKKPLSDSQISEMLREQGIECARRTVAKYREALRIAPANLRKSL